MSYQILLDLWEENAQFDELLAKNAGIAGVIVRLNDMQGGHHMDSNFLSEWEQIKIFDVRGIYFVYNPWVKGKVNCQWFLDHAPTDAGRVMFLDVEVKYAGYSSKEYANQVEDCIRLLQEAGWRVIIYTGLWFLGYLNRWPKTVDYWWARYPDAALPNLNTWAEMINKAQALAWQPDLANGKTSSPGPVKLWQASDKWSPPGSYSHAVDVNLFNGTREDLVAYFGGTAPVLQERVPWEELDQAGKLERLKTLAVAAGWNIN